MQRLEFVVLLVIHMVASVSELAGICLYLSKNHPQELWVSCGRNYNSAANRSSKKEKLDERAGRPDTVQGISA